MAMVAALRRGADIVSGTYCGVRGIDEKTKSEATTTPSPPWRGRGLEKAVRPLTHSSLFASTRPLTLTLSPSAGERETSAIPQTWP